MTDRSAVWHRLLVAIGVAALPRRAAALTGATVAVGLLAAAAGVALRTEPASGPTYPLVRFVFATAVMATAQLARLRLRLASGAVNVTWAEVALVICFHVAPAAWLPAAAFVGAGLAWLLLSAFDGRRAVGDVIAVAASSAIAAALAAAATVAVADPYEAALTPTVAGALAVGALTYLLAAAGLAALTFWARHGLPIGRSMVDMLLGKLPMFAGNLAVGLAAVALLHHGVGWLLLLPPVLLLLQQAYRQRLRADTERRVWRDYARAVKTLNQLDEHAVAVSGVDGALRVLGATHVALDVVREDGGRRRYHGDSSGVSVDDRLAERWPGDTREIVCQPLAVAGEPVGELRLRLPRCVPFGSHEAAVLSAYGEALAAALRNAATHRRQLNLVAGARHAAAHDPLTQLLNRAALLDRGDRALRRVDGDPVALVVLDIDNFTKVNETLGHAAGDELLRQTADRLRGLARPGDLLGRIGDDEFAILVTALPAVTARGPTPSMGPHALRRARQVAERLAEAIEVADVRMSAEISVGVAWAQAGTTDMAELLRRAEIALHHAKEKGGVASYDGARDAANTDHLTVLAELREALAVDDQLVLALQPAVDLTTGAPTGVEALIRWHHPRRGRLNPTEFIHIVENSELLAPFTRYVIDKALAVAADWARHGLSVPISVNLCARSLLDPRLPAEVAELLRHHRVPPQQLVLEITETVEVSDLEVIDEVLGALQTLGVKLAVDDFGTGFSSLAFLTRITVDELKVDRSFVMRMADSAEAAAIVRATVALGRELGLRVVAEGVETAEQRRALAALGCEAAQGYHFFKPMPSDKVVTVLRSLLDSAKVFPLSAESTS